MLQRFFVISCFLLTSIGVFSQDSNMVEKKSDVPLSIFIGNDYPDFMNRSIADNLKLKDFKFLIFNDEDLIRNSFRIDLRNIGRRGTKFSSQTYKDFDLYKHFPVVPDIITLHRFNTSTATIEVN